MRLFAQDSVFFYDGQIVRAKILEIQKDAVVYKKFSYPDGPSYTVSKTELKLIRYPDGSIDSFPKANLANVSSSSNPATIYIYRKPNMFSSARIFDLFVNDSFLVTVRNGTLYKYETTANNLHFFGQIDKREANYDLRLEPGKVYYIKCNISGGMFKEKPTIAMPPYNMGLSEVDRMIHERKVFKRDIFSGSAAKDTTSTKKKK
jgi:hypothetical protein